MNLNIITVFKTNNCGSFLQAWALKKVIEDFGHKVRFVDYRSQSDNKRNVLINIAKSCAKLNFGLARYQLLKKIKFSRFQKSFSIASKNDIADLYVFGSDTLWNFSDAFFFRNASFFTGASLNAKKISYAISVGSSKIEDFKKIDNIEESIKSFSAISLRDEYSYSVVSSICSDIPISISCDPTMLLECNDYSELEEPCAEDNFILFYYFGGAP